MLIYKYLYSLIFLLFSFSILKAQPYYIYVQSAEKANYSVQVNGKKYTSNVAGETMIAGLKNGIHSLLFLLESGAKKLPVAATIKDKNVGLLLKKEGAKGYKVFAIKADKTAVAKKENASVAPANVDVAFGNMLAEVTGDSTLFKTEPIPVAAKNIEKPLATETKVDTLNTTEAVDTDASTTKGVIKANEQAINGATQITFIAFEGNKVDTVTIALANKPVVAPESPVTILENEVKPLTNTINKATISKPQVNPTVPPINEPTAAKQDSFIVKSITDTTANPFFEKEKPAISTSTKQYNFSNNTCAVIATKEDFQKLRKKMVSTSVETDMLKIAKKQFELKCFTTEQVSSLANMFLSDDGRYDFFALSIKKISDIANFPQLKKQLIDDNYQQKFEQLLAEHSQQ